MNNPIIRSTGILIARIGLGIVFLAHGLQKINTYGFSGTKASFEGMDVPLAPVSAFAVTWLEILGGIALIAGLLTPIVGILFFLDMLGAYFFAHIDAGLWVSDGGYELVLALGAGALLLAVVGAGRFSVDAVLGTKVGWLAADGPRTRETVNAG
ncbi:putative oxidoreductase [Williamsia limnetica]|uniref:Putative oxidoreductase n=1 Tax=Williamsia limnetica TaxID=882452 RepID=A0A318S7N5_WILLI|nr:DoxX family protein [Williamsia limnetica]PYE20784.1 putative oxidoreductase [Williamsia limnetica]